MKLGYLSKMSFTMLFLKRSRSILFCNEFLGLQNVGIFYILYSIVDCLLYVLKYSLLKKFIIVYQYWVVKEKILLYWHLNTIYDNILLCSINNYSYYSY